MKKILLGFITIIVICFLSSCKKNETEAPTIYLETADGFIFKDTVLAAGTNYNVKLVAEMGDANITNIVIKNTHDGEPISYFDTGVNNEKIVISKILTKNVFESETWTFMAIDKNGKNASVSFTVKMDTASVYHDVLIFDGRVLGAQNCPSAGSFMSVRSGHIWFQADAFDMQDSIELLYYYDPAGDNNTIASPGANIDATIYSSATSPIYWAVRNETRFFKTTYTTADFNNIQNDSLLLVAYDEINGKRKAKNLVAGDVYSFKTTHAKYGMFAVESVTGADSGTIQFSLRIQK
ncbi:MAG TPA: hypothetical protein PKI01_08800 [Bacteroidales bacterium]|nr:hypothetical protein [Bacteroidales bacterium]